MRLIDSTRVVLGTWNMGDGDKATKARALVEAIRSAPRLVALVLCETGDQGPTIATVCERTDWHCYRDEHQPQANHVTVAWNPDLLRVHHASARLLVARRNVGPQGAGPTSMEPKYGVRLSGTIPGVRHDIHFVGTHYLPSWTVNFGNDPADRWEEAQRDDHAHDQSTALARMVSSKAGHVFVAGDLNGERDEQIFDPLRKAHLRFDQTHDTHDVRCIDQVAHRLSVDLDVAESYVRPMPSDHKISLVAYRLRNKTSAPPTRKETS